MAVISQLTFQDHPVFCLDFLVFCFSAPVPWTLMNLDPNLHFYLYFNFLNPPHPWKPLEYEKSSSSSRTNKSRITKQNCPFPCYVNHSQNMYCLPLFLMPIYWVPSILLGVLLYRYSDIWAGKPEMAYLEKGPPAFIWFLAFLNAGDDKYLHHKPQFCKLLANACWPSKYLNLAFTSQQWNVTKETHIPRQNIFK